MKISKIMYMVALLIGLSIVTTSDAFGQYSDVSSPKKQIESGVEPNEVVCRDGLVLATRSNGSVACVKDSIAEKFNWEIIATNFSDSGKTEKSTQNSNNNEKTLIENDKSEEPQIPWREDLVPRLGLPKKLVQFTDPQSGIVPMGQFKSAIQIPEKNADMIASKIAKILDDGSAHHKKVGYRTDRGAIYFSYTGENISGFNYGGYTNGIISYEKGAQIVEKLTDLLGITFDGTEHVKNNLNPHGAYYFIYVQQKDDLRITSNIVRLDLGPGFTQILVGDWLENIPELELYDPNKLPEISMSYAKQFEVLAEPPCSISNRGADKPLNLKFMNSSLVYESYAGSCQHTFEMFNPSFYTYIDAITGEPLFIKRGISY